MLSFPDKSKTTFFELYTNEEFHNWFSPDQNWEVPVISYVQLQHFFFKIELKKLREIVSTKHF